MKRLMLFLIPALLVGWSCSPDDAPSEANPVSSSPIDYSAKALASYNPFAGLDEDGYVDGVGSAKNYRDLLQMFARRVALAQQDDRARQIFVQAINRDDNGRVNITRLLLGHPALLDRISEGFINEVQEARTEGRLDDIIGILDDRKAFLTMSEILWGLEVSLIDRAGTYGGQTPVEVFHNPVLDEKDTDYYEGFDPDGKPVESPFDMQEGFVEDGPFLFISYDEDFLYYPENRPKTAMSQPKLQLRPTLLLGLNPMNLFVKRAWAHGRHSNPIPDCYHDRSIYLTRFRFSDDHDPGTRPEVYFKTHASFRYLPSPWKDLKKEMFDYPEADEEDTTYPEEGSIYPEINEHLNI